MTNSLTETFFEKCDQLLDEKIKITAAESVCNEAILILSQLSDTLEDSCVFDKLSDTLKRFTFTPVQHDRLNEARHQFYFKNYQIEFGPRQIEVLVTTKPTPQNFKNLYILEFNEGEPLIISQAELSTFGDFFVTLVQALMKESVEKKIKLHMDREHFLIIRSFLRDEEIELEDPNTWWVLRTLSDFFQLKGVVLPSEPTFISAREAIIFTKNYGLPNLSLLKFPLEKHDLDLILTLTNLKRLVIDIVASEDGWIENLPDSIEFLIILELENVTSITKTPKNLKTIKFLNCTKLEHLELHDNITSLCLIGLQQPTLKLSQNLHTLVLYTALLPDNLLENLPQTLREFTTSIEFTDSLVSKLSSTLTTLKLMRCSELTDASIPLLSRSLIDLEIGYAPKLTNACIPSFPPLLKKLSLRTPGIHFHSGIVFSNTLEELHISQNSKIDPSFESQLNPKIKLKKDL